MFHARGSIGPVYGVESEFSRKVNPTFDPDLCVHTAGTYWMPACDRMSGWMNGTECCILGQGGALSSASAFALGGSLSDTRHTARLSLARFVCAYCILPVQSCGGGF